MEGRFELQVEFTINLNEFVNFFGVAFKFWLY